MTTPWIINELKRIGHEYFVGPYNVNIVGCRTKDYRMNKFDDFLFVVFQDHAGRWIVKQYECTTRPGLLHLRNPINPDGVAILVPGQYLSTYMVALHAGKYPALCQRLKPVMVYRDNNEDAKFDFPAGSIQEGMFGINIHAAGMDSENVGHWSAGCQVLKRKRDFNDFMHWINVSRKLYGNSFSYTLLTEEQITV